MSHIQEHIRVLTVRQPFATLLLFGEKLWETRSMFTNHTGTYLLHAAKSMGVNEKILCNNLFVKSALRRCGIHHYSELPTGHLLGSFRVEKCHLIGTSIQPEELSPLERKIGLWNQGHFAWEVRDMRQLKTPILYTNGQGIYRKYKGELSRLTFTDGTSMAEDHLPHFQPKLF